MAFQRQQGISGVLLKANVNLMFLWSNHELKIAVSNNFLTIFRIVGAKSKIVCLSCKNNGTNTWSNSNSFNQLPQSLKSF